MKRLLLAAALVPLLACATSSAFRAGEKAERLQDYDKAVLEYSRAVQEKPDGQPCLGDNECQSGHCTDGFCCNSTCGAICGRTVRTGT